MFQNYVLFCVRRFLIFFHHTSGVFSFKPYNFVSFVQFFCVCFDLERKSCIYTSVFLENRVWILLARIVLPLHRTFVRFFLALPHFNSRCLSWQNAELRWESNLGSYAAFTLDGFDDQERNLTFVKMNFQVLKLKFHACSFKHAFYPLPKTNYYASLTTQKYFYTSFLFGTWLSNLHV